jgi:hypothetical protein
MVTFVILLTESGETKEGFRRIGSWALLWEALGIFGKSTDKCCWF